MRRRRFAAKASPGSTLAGRWTTLRTTIPSTIATSMADRAGKRALTPSATRTASAHSPSPGATPATEESPLPHRSSPLSPWRTEGLRRGAPVAVAGRDTTCPGDRVPPASPSGSGDDPPVAVVTDASSGGLKCMAPWSRTAGTRR